MLEQESYSYQVWVQETRNKVKEGIASLERGEGIDGETFVNQLLVFLNFYNVGGTFDEIQFSNIGGSGFESDNHTIATGFKTITGDVVKSVPESSSAPGVFAIAFVGAASVLTRRVKKKSALQLS